jgi:NADH-quinone oxidoreductase subunit N
LSKTAFGTAPICLSTTSPPFTKRIAGIEVIPKFILNVGFTSTFTFPIFTLPAYSVASLGAFACLDAISNNGEDNEKITALRGLASRQPVLAFFFSILVLSLAGIPPVAGFFAKYYIFYGAMQSNYIWLLVIAVISSLIGVYYYFRLIFTMFQPSEGEQHTIISSSHGALLILAALISLCIGIYPNLILGLL